MDSRPSSGHRQTRQTRDVSFAGDRSECSPWIGVTPLAIDHYRGNDGRVRRGNATNRDFSSLEVEVTVYFTSVSTRCNDSFVTVICVLNRGPYRRVLPGQQT